MAAQVVLSLSQCTYTQPGLTGDILSFFVNFSGFGRSKS